MKLFLIALLLSLNFAFAVSAQNVTVWQKMTDADLTKVVPERAPVLKENIETELRTAAGITNGAQNIFGVTIITAGYEADGKYTHFFKNDANLLLGDLQLAPGAYVFGYKRLDNETLRVTFYSAKTGGEVGKVKARVEPKKGAIYSFLIEPPTNDVGQIYIGRFVVDYSLKKSFTE